MKIYLTKVNVGTYIVCSVYNTTILFINIKVIYCQGDMFRPSPGHLQALKGKQIQDYIDFFIKRHCGIPNAQKMCYKDCDHGIPQCLFKKIDVILDLFFFEGLKMTR